MPYMDCKLTTAHRPTNKSITSLQTQTAHLPTYEQRNMPYFSDRGLIEFCETAQELPTVLTLLKSGTITQMQAEDIFREHRSKKVKKLDDADIDWDEKKNKDLVYADIDWDEMIATGEIEDLSAKTLKLYLEEHDITVKGNKSAKIEAIIEHYDDNHSDPDESEEEEEVEVADEGLTPPTDSESQEEDDGDMNPSNSEAEEESGSDEEDDSGSEEEEEVDMDVEEIQGVNYAIHDGIARDVKTGTVMGPVGSPVSDTNVTKWGVNVALHLKNVTENMATQ